MNRQLDTHTFLWSISAPEKLPNFARSVIEDRANAMFVSAVSFWEIAIKVRFGKLTLGSDADTVEAAVKAGFVPLPLTPEEAATSAELEEDSPFDPFDRMLIWQAISRDLTLISGDADPQRFKRFGLKLLWN